MKGIQMTHYNDSARRSGRYQVKAAVFAFACLAVPFALGMSAASQLFFILTALVGGGAFMIFALGEHIYPYHLNFHHDRIVTHLLVLAWVLCAGPVTSLVLEPPWATILCAFSIVAALTDSISIIDHMRSIRRNRKHKPQPGLAVGSRN